MLKYEGKFLRAMGTKIMAVSIISYILIYTETYRQRNTMYSIDTYIGRCPISTMFEREARRALWMLVDALIHHDTVSVVLRTSK